MAVLRPSELRKMQKKDADKRLLELRLELAKIKGNISMGASAQSPGRIKEIRRAIARIKTIETENSRKAPPVKGQTKKEKVGKEKQK
jgi:large subunit ribosomal protein L29